MNTGKKGVQILAEICKKAGIRKVVISPGSRSAPLYIAFSQMDEIECLAIPDERVAGYFALGLAQQSGLPVAVVCTSGTAVLNLSPAVCEAYYQNIPLLLLTADRPEGAASTGENQAIMQENIFGNFTVSNYDVNAEVTSQKDCQDFSIKVHHAVHDLTTGLAGPVHINIHIDEPLYEPGTVQTNTNYFPVEKKTAVKEFISLKDTQRIKSAFAQFHRKLIIIGKRNYNEEVFQLLTILNQRSDVVIVHEHLSNFPLSETVWNIDPTLSIISNENSFIPDIVITLGNQILSKKLKQFLKNKPKIHWDVPPGSGWGRAWAAFGNMFEPIEPVNEIQFLTALVDVEETNHDLFKNHWLSTSGKAAELSKSYCNKLDFCDLKAYEYLIESYPTNSHIQYGNSTPVRYSAYFKHHPSVTVNANRGTSGIDGCVSTAAGAAYLHSTLTICVVGDISFFYDSNSLWNNYLSPQLRIVIINNGGGNIFRLLEGPQNAPNFERFFETRHPLHAQHLATMFGLPYYICASLKQLSGTLHEFYSDSDKAKILEIKTDGVFSAEVYKQYFDYLKSNK